MNATAERENSSEAKLLAALQNLAASVDTEADARKLSDRPLRPEIYLEQMLDQYLPSRGLPDAQLGSHAGMKGNIKSTVGGCTVSDDGKRLVVFNMDYRSATELWTAQRPALISLASQTLRFLKDALNKTSTGPLSVDARAVADRIVESFDHVEAVTIVLFTDGVFTGKEIDLDPIDGRSVECEVFDIRSLSRLTDRSVRDVSVPFVDRVGNPLAQISKRVDDTSYECSLIILPGEFLADLYEEYDVALLEHNVRAFLGSSNKVNVGIRRTLKNNQERFLAYNNGLSATARDVEFNEDRSAIIFVHGLQIVNGGQTLAALHHVKYAEKTDISRAEVIMKLTVVREGDQAQFVGELSSYANTQSIVQIADFSANRPFHIEIERLSRSVWIPGERGLWFFERTRGQYNVARSREGNSTAAKKRFKSRCPPARKFSKTDIAKFINAWSGAPHLVSNGAQYNYQAWLDRVEEEDWTPTEDWYKALIAQAIIFKAAQKAVREGNFPGYRAQIVAYLVALVGDRIKDEIDLNVIWQRQGVSPEFQNLLSLWAPMVENSLKQAAGRSNVTQFCKRPECWDAVCKVPTSTIELALPESREIVGK
ncbi:AIPR family protein [Agrobacterium sp. B1(2019)]|uniref:AIPR family protein n=1 Tax=Agrobacterium sp. B1(2019) TaxID=2607032 RepID=UPI0011F0277E|nr:AIPR family protein [Agrobacterium sp. B1(2019)]TZG34292.1 AIPR family protein [Agrobacterium sp. B1(2019)]